MLRRALVIVLLLAAASLAAAQAVPDAEKGRASLWAGAGYSRFQPDFGPNTMGGVTGFASLNLGRWGVDANLRFLRFNSFHGETQTHYLAGPRYFLFPMGRLKPFAGLLFGVGTIHYPFEIGNGSYFAYAPYGGAEFRLTHRVALRADYEYQFWPAAPGIAGEPNHGLTPSGLTIGAAWRVF
ncbi:MAG TPA: outer membrane beta-barrel protein [Terracidiphilus sp.]|jgi:opacity protein-like surface antigen|nr:outer membrane beta-barrel protein [Terracidiphilus sp.]